MERATAGEGGARPLEDFFREMDGRRARAQTATAARRADLFERIAGAGDEPAEGQALAAAPALTKAAREAIRREQLSLEGGGFLSSYNAMLSAVTPARAVKMAWRGALGAAVISGIIAGAVWMTSGVGKMVAELDREEEARKAFLSAGWRVGVKGVSVSGEGDARREMAYVSYLRELSPDDGRVLLKVTDKTGRGDFSYELSGWARTEGLRTQVIGEITSVFPYRPDPALIGLRPGGAKLAEGEARVLEPEERYSMDGTRVAQLGYGESGYASVDAERRTTPFRRADEPKPTNIVTGTPPARGEAYVYVIGGGDATWRSDGQREKLLRAAFGRLKAAPDGGRGCVAVHVAYQNGGLISVERAAVGTSGEAVKSQVSAGQSGTLSWPADDYTNKTQAGGGRGGSK